MSASEQTAAELQDLADRALQYVRDGKPEHAEDCFRRMSRILADLMSAPDSPAVRGGE